MENSNVYLDMVNKRGIPTLIGNQSPVVQPIATGFSVELFPVIMYSKMYGMTQREICGICHSRFLENCENSRLGSPKYDNQPSRGRTSLNAVTANDIPLHSPLYMNRHYTGASHC
jgi:hypothetical protein